MAILGIVMATTCAIQGQTDARELDILQREHDRLLAADLLRNARSRHASPERITQLQKRLYEAQAAGLSSYLKPGRQFTQWDGFRYEEVAREGYVYEPSDEPTVMVPPRVHAWDDPPGPHRIYSAPYHKEFDQVESTESKWEPRLKNVVWYPLYPMLGRGLARITGLQTHHALTAISWACICAASMVMFALLRRHFYNRLPMPSPGKDEDITRRWDLTAADTGALWGVALLLYGPCSIFLYANFTESLFVLLLASFLLAIQSRAWWWAAGIAAIASASRSQGCLFAPILFLAFMLRSDIAGSVKRTFIALVLGAIGGLGVCAYMLYLFVQFGDPLAFVHAQQYWGVGINATTISYALNPIHALTHFFHMAFEQPLDLPRLYEASAVIIPPVVILLLGARFLSFELEIMAWVLWALPYVSNSLAGSPGYPGENAWMSMGRFAAVMIPLHVIWAAVLVRFRWLSLFVLVPSAGAFTYFAYLYGGGRWIG